MMAEAVRVARLKAEEATSGALAAGDCLDLRAPVRLNLETLERFLVNWQEENADT
jgi:hypothetical protein